MKLINNFLNVTSQYRLVLYYLIFLLVAGLSLSFFGYLLFNPLSLLVLVLICLLTCFVSNKFFSAIFKIPANIESAFITALILSLLLQPPSVLLDLILPVVISLLAMASKYILNFRGKHIFNPVAISLVIAYFALNFSPSWWVSSTIMLPFVLPGILIVKKLKRFTLLLSFILAFSITSFALTLSLVDITTTSLYLFFAFVMLTEPRTTPPTRLLQSIYGILVGVLSVPYLSLGPFVATPEPSLVLGNIFSFLVSPKFSLKLKLKQKTKLSDSIYTFAFHPEKPLNYQPGQYMEWTLPLKNIDSRGNRRYFTLTSSPTEQDLMIGVRFSTGGSKFKEKLLNLTPQDTILAGSLSGDFTLPSDQSKKLVFLAGGIGITPFRSMLKFLADTGQSRDIIVFYSTTTFSDEVFKDILELSSKFGVKVYYAITNVNSIPKNYQGIKGFINEEQIRLKVADYSSRTFYISGPPAMVDSFKGILSKMKVPGNQIKTDYFPGYV